VSYSETPASLAGPISSLTNLAQGRRTSDRLRQAVTAMAVGQAVWQASKIIRGAYEAKTTYQFTVHGHDEMYDELLREILGLIPQSKRRAVVANSVYDTGDDGPVSVYEDNEWHELPRIRSLALGYDGSAQTIKINGHRIKVVIDRPDWSHLAGSDDRMKSMLANKEMIVFKATGEAARDAVQEFLSGFADLRVGQERPPVFRLALPWGSWAARNDVPLRSMDSVVLAAGQLEDLIADMEEFLRNEKPYAEVGIPWHRGYLFEGPPGTGKTSVAKALANHFRMDVYYLPLADMQEDTNLLRLVSEIKPRSMLVLEDIDTAKVATEREENFFSASMSGLLNALDGFATPHGLVTVMTTNHVNMLDDALIRTGRVDRKLHLGFVDNEQFGRMVALCYGEEMAEQVKGLDFQDKEVSPAEVIEVFKKHVDDPEAALLGFKELSLKS